MKSIGLMTAVLVMLVFTASFVIADSATLIWVDPTTRIDGTAFSAATDASRHTVYYSASPTLSTSSYTTKIDLSATATTYTVTTLPTGTTYFIVTISDKLNQESAPSNTGSKYVLPAKPAGCTLTVN